MTDITLPPPAAPSRNREYYLGLLYATAFGLPTILGIALGGHYLGYSVEIWEGSVFFDRLITSLLLVLGFAASLLAIRGDTYNTAIPGPFYRKITLHGRTAIGVIALTFFVGAVKEGRTESSHDSELAQQKIVIEATVAGQTDRLRQDLSNAEAAISRLIDSSITGLSDTQRSELKIQVGSLLAGVHTSAGDITNNLEAKSRETARMLDGATAMLASLSHPETGVSASVRQTGSVVVDTLNKVLAANATLQQQVDTSASNVRQHVTDQVEELASAFGRELSKTQAALVERDSVLEVRVRTLAGLVDRLAERDSVLAVQVEGALSRLARTPASDSASAGQGN